MHLSHRNRLQFWLVMGVTAAALVASAILLVDYVKPAPVFCDAEGGCGVMRRTVFAYPMGIPMPLIGLGGFLAIGLAQMVAGHGARVVQALLAGVGAVVGAGLLAVQLSLHTICPFCAVTDTASIALLALSFWRLRGQMDPPAPTLPRGLASAGLALAAAIPVGIGMGKKPPPPPPRPPQALPDAIAQEMSHTPKGTVTVVDFVDYECPFCRMTHAALSPLLDARAAKLRVVRKNVPLRMHAHAMDAAKAACCGEKMGKAHEMTEALFASPPEGLTPEGCEAIAVAQGLDAAAFRTCVADPATLASINADIATFKASAGQGLPTIYIDSTMFEGSQDKATLEHALDAAIHASM